MNNEQNRTQSNLNETIINVEPVDNDAEELAMNEHQKASSTDTEIEIMRYLLSNGASYTHESTSTYNATALHLAARQGNIKFLLALHNWINANSKDKTDALETFMSTINIGKRSVVQAKRISWMR
jgi:hypothetical protein